MNIPWLSHSRFWSPDQVRSFLSIAANRAVDEYAINQCGIAGKFLMQNAGTGVVDQMDVFGYLKNAPEVLVLTGKGNNGGDGYVIASELFKRNISVSLISLTDQSGIKGDALFHYEKLLELDVKIDVWQDNSSQRELIQSADIIVDALLGTGISGEIKEPYKEIIENCNNSKGKIIAVDIPSGVCGNKGEVLTPCIKADQTVSMGFGKQASLFEPARSQCGKVTTVDIGFPDDALEHINDQILSEISGEDFPKSLFTRPIDAHKYSSGKVLIVAGSKGFTGAAILASTAALRAGAGLVKLALPESLGHIGEIGSLESIVEYLPETDEHSFSKAATEQIKTSCDWADVVAIGPGIGRHPETQELVLNLISNIDGPLVLDADALYALSGNLDTLSQRQYLTVLTPHMGEFKRLLDWQTQIQPDWEDAQKFAIKYGVYLLLKGAPSILAAPDGSVSVNSSGYSGMATAGSGDVLTGVIAGLWSQWSESPEVLQFAMFIHGTAAEINRTEKGVLGLIASDIVNQLPQALKEYGGLPV